MSTSGTNPPPVCKVKLAIVKREGEAAPANCTAVTTNTMFVVLSDNPDDAQTATVSWDDVSIPVQAEAGNNLMLKGTTTEESTPPTVSVKFGDHEATPEPCTTGICIPTGC